MSTRDFRQKIKTLEELAVAVGPRPRPKTVIMCHGTFDIVHPGHLRHLMYAKKKADPPTPTLPATRTFSRRTCRRTFPRTCAPPTLAPSEWSANVFAIPIRPRT